MTDPHGHSFGVPPAPVPPAPAPEHWRQCAEYLHGVDLYNHGYWWEAHEAWEGLWRGVPTEAEPARFLRGLIQVAAARLKVEAGERAGAARVLARSAENFEPVLEGIRARGERRYMGLEVAAWWDRARRLADEPEADVAIVLG